MCVFTLSYTTKASEPKKSRHNHLATLGSYKSLLDMSASGEIAAQCLIKKIIRKIMCACVCC